MHLIDINNYPFLDITDDNKKLEYVTNHKKFIKMEWIDIAFNYKLYSKLDSYLSFNIDYELQNDRYDPLGQIMYEIL